jgi:hypothetical protein
VNLHRAQIYFRELYLPQNFIDDSPNFAMAQLIGKLRDGSQGLRHERCDNVLTDLDVRNHSSAIQLVSFDFRR